MTEQLQFHALEKEMATYSSVFAWRIPGMGEPYRLPSMGSHRVGHDWSDLAAAGKPHWLMILHLCDTGGFCLYDVKTGQWFGMFSAWSIDLVRSSHQLFFSPPLPGSIISWKAEKWYINDNFPPAFISWISSKRKYCFLFGNPKLKFTPERQVICLILSLYLVFLISWFPRLHKR